MDYYKPEGKYRKIHIAKTKSEKGEFTCINIKAMSQAMRDLTSSGFKLWCYLNKNKDGYELSLSPAAVTNFTGISRSSYLKAFKELYNKNYLSDFFLQKLDVEGYLFLEDAAQNSKNEYFNDSAAQD